MPLLKDARFNALLVEPEQPPREVWVHNSLDGLSTYISGAAISKYDVPGDSVCFLYSATPACGNRRLNRAVFNENDGVAFIITGPFLVAGRLYEDRLCGLCHEQVEEYRRLFLVPHVFVRENNNVVPWRGKDG
jgi:hypothetical protein